MSSYRPIPEVFGLAKDELLLLGKAHFLSRAFLMRSRHLNPVSVVVSTVSCKGVCDR